MADDLDEGRRMKQVDTKTHRTAFKHVAPTRPRPRAGPPPHRDPCADSGPELPRSVPRGGRGWAGRCQGGAADGQARQPQGGDGRGGRRLEWAGRHWGGAGGDRSTGESRRGVGEKEYLGPSWERGRRDKDRRQRLKTQILLRPARSRPRVPFL
jgi:hypothetical protein